MDTGTEYRTCDDCGEAVRAEHLFAWTVPASTVDPGYTDELCARCYGDRLELHAGHYRPAGARMWESDCDYEPL